MPTILFLKGYRFFFYSLENDEPKHIHIAKAGSEAKFWIEPDFKLAWSRGFKLNELRQISEIIEKNKDQIKSKWDEYFK